MSQAKTSTTKELKVFSKQVVTVDEVRKDKRKLMLLHVIRSMGGISERGLSVLLHTLKSQKNMDIGYNFVLVGEIPNSKELLEDIRVLLYLGLLETDPSTRKLKLTSSGLEFLETSKLPEDELSKLEEYINEIKPKVIAEEATIEMLLKSMQARGKKRRR